MPDNIPFEIQTDIMKRLPVKSLLQFRSVCKRWKSMIDSPDFVKHYSHQIRHLLISFRGKLDLGDKYVSVIDDDSFPKHRVSLTQPPLVSMLKYSDIISSSHGLLCLYGYYDALQKYMAVLWNPSIRKAVGVVVPHVAENRIYETVLGFGVCHETSDPKIVKIRYIDSPALENLPDDIPWQVEVFTLSTRMWRSPHSTNLPRKSIEFEKDGNVVIDGIFYWLATDWFPMDGEFKSYNLIISFDMTSEEFKEINLPDSFTHDPDDGNMYISKLRESLVVVERHEREMISVVWIMGGGVAKTFTKLHTIDTRVEIILTVLEFRKSGEPVMSFRCKPDDDSSLVVYDPYSKHFTNLEISGKCLYPMYSYVETMLLLGQPDFTIYNT